MLVGVSLLGALSGAGCEMLQRPEQHLDRAQAHLAAGHAAEALATVERHGLLATPPGRVLGVEALMALDRPLEAVDLLGLAPPLPADVRARACRAALPVAALSADRPTRDRVREHCGEVVQPEAQSDLLLHAYSLALHDRLPDYRTRRLHLAKAGVEPTLVEPLARIWDVLGERLVLGEQRATALRTAWALAPGPERAARLIDRFEQEALAAVERSPQEAITWFEHLSRPGRVPHLPVPDDVRMRAFDHVQVLSEALTIQGVVTNWESRRRARDEDAGIWVEAERVFRFPSEPLEERDTRLRDWFVDRAGWPPGTYRGLAPWRDEGLCEDAEAVCRIPLETFARWGADLDGLTDTRGSGASEPEER